MFRFAMLTLLNWNLEWATARAPRNALIWQAIEAHAPQIICLTEAYLDAVPPGWHVLSAVADYGYPLVPGRRKVILLSKRPWRRSDNATPPDMPPGRYIYGETDTPLGKVGVHGLCIPWAAAHVSSGRRDRRRWQEHRDYLAALPTCLDREGSCPQQVIVGDFNQRVPRRNTPQAVYEALLAALNGRFTLITTGKLPPYDRQTVDHIGLNATLAATAVFMLPNEAADGRHLSDHPGIVSTLRTIP